MEENIVQGNQAPAVEPASGDPFHGQVLDAITKALASSGQQVPPQQVPPQQVPPQQVDTRPSLSTAPVGDVTSMFLDQQTPAPSPSAIPQLPPDIHVDQPEGMTEKANYAWQEIRARERMARQTAEALRAELTRVTEQAGKVADERVKFAEEIKNRDDRIKKLEEDLGRLDLSHKPEFHQQYDQPMSDIMGQIESALEDATNLSDRDAIRSTASKLVDATDQDFSRLVSRLSSPAQSSLWDKRREYLALRAEREQALSDWRETQQGVEVQDDQQKLVERSQHRREIAEGAIDYVKNVVPPDKRVSVLSESTYAADVENVDQQFRGFMQTAKESEMARMTYQGFLVPVMQRQLAYMTEAMNEWRDAYYRLRGAGSPPALPMRMQSEVQQAPVVQAPQVVEGANFQGTIQNTVEATLRRAGLRL